ncbi:MAG TPA: DUF3365 domain-containing protein [Phaeodactylibacter sp.]|nr:DUF3365 domain-containing protein [Phaeodactylibacter sp.]
MKKQYLLFALALMGYLAACDSGSKAGQEETATDSETATTLDTAKYKKQGMEIAMGTFKALSGQLKSALQEGGVPNAVRYCNTVAYPLVDSLSEVYNASIRRASDKVRNPKDAPTPLEQEVLDTYHAQMAAGEQPKPVVRQLQSGEIAFYAPIRMQELCLNCHGKLGETLKKEDYAVIKELYPEDEAIGYAAGDLRGIWSITFQEDAGK